MHFVGGLHTVIRRPALLLFLAILLCLPSLAAASQFPVGSLSVVNSAGDTIPATGKLIVNRGETFVIQVMARTETASSFVYAALSYDTKLAIAGDTVRMEPDGFNTFFTPFVLVHTVAGFPTINNDTGLVRMALESLGGAAAADDTMALVYFFAKKPGYLQLAFYRAIGTGQATGADTFSAIAQAGISQTNRFETGWVQINFIDTPALVSPANNSETDNLRPLFTWTFADTGGADSFVMQLDTSPVFAGINRGDTVANRSGATDTFVPVANLPSDTYYWRVRGITADGMVSGWSPGCTLYVKRTAALNITAIYRPAADSMVTRGQAGADSVLVEMRVANVGDTTAAITGHALSFWRAGVNVTGSFTVVAAASNPDSIQANSSETLAYRVAVAAGAGTGYTDIRGYVSGYDSSFLTAIADGSDSDGSGDGDTSFVIVLTPASLSVIRVSVFGDTLSRGQTGSDSVRVTMTVQNSGEAAAVNLIDTLTFWRGVNNVSDSFAAVLVSEPALIPGGVTEIFEYRVSVAAGAETGIVFVDGTCTGTDSNAANLSSWDSGAVFTDSFLLQAAANLVIISVSSDTASVFQGQAGSVNMVVKNTGEAAADLTDSGIAVRRLAGDTVVSDSYTITNTGGPSSINGGETVMLTYTVAVGASADTGWVVLDGYCTGTDRNWTSRVIADTSAAPDTDLWDIQGAGVLDLMSVTVAADTASRGQTTLQVVLVFRNIGDGAITGLDTPALTFVELGLNRTGDYDTALTAATTVFPATVGVNSQVTCTFAVTVGPAADTGYISVGGVVRGLISGGVGTALDTTATVTDTFFVQARAQIVIDSIDVTAEPLTQGQAGFTVNYYLSNTGEAAALITGDTDAVTHALGGQSDSWVRTGASLTGTLVPGGTNKAAYPVVYRLDISADTGIHYFDGAITATDANDSGQVGDTTAGANGDTVTVDAARPIVVTSLTASVTAVTAGQNSPDSWYVTVTLQNTTPNDSAVVTDIGDTNLVFSVGGLTALDYAYNFDSVTVNDTQLAPGDSCVLRYKVTATGDSTGTLRLDATVSGTQALSGAAARHSTVNETTVPDTVTVLTPASLHVRRVVAAADSVTRGQTGGDSVLVTVWVYNSGQATAIRLDDTLTFRQGVRNVTDSYALSLTGESLTIPGGDTGTFVYRVSVLAGADTGFVVLDGWCTGTDINASNIQTADSSVGAAAIVDTWHVQSPAQLKILAVVSDTATVYQGYGGYAVRVTVQNLGEAPADFTDSGVWFRRAAGATNVSDSYIVLFAGGAASVAGGGTTALNYTVTVKPGAETGAVYIDGYCTGADRNWTNNRTADTTAVPDTDIWDVQGAGVIDIISVTANLDTVSRSQTTLQVVLVFRNSGNGLITNVDTPVLTFTELGTVRTADYDTAVTGTDTFFPVTMQIGMQLSCTYSLTVHANADTGYICVDGSVAGDICGGAAVAADSFATTADTFLVQTPAQLVIQSLDVTTEPLTQGQTGFTVNYYLSNTGEADARLTGDTDAVTHALGMQSDSWVRTGASLAGTMVPGRTNNVAYPVVYRLDISADTGVHYFDGVVSATDANDSRSAGDTTADGSGDTVIVNAARPIVVTALAAAVTSVTAGQGSPDSWYVTVTLQNTTANDSAVVTDIGDTNLVFSVGGLTATDYTYNFDSVTVNDTQLAPGDSCVLRYKVTATGDSTGTLRLDATVSGTQALSGAAARHSTVNETTVPDTVAVLTPASLHVRRVVAAADSVTRGQTGGDSVLVTVWVYNSGQATAIRLDDTLTFRQGVRNVTDSYALSLAGESLTIPGGDTGTFVYRVSVLAGADTGFVVLDGWCTGTDINASNIQTADSSAGAAAIVDTWHVQSPAQLKILAVASDTATVYQGQGGYAVQVTVQNLGEAPADFTDSGVWFRRAAGDTNVSDSYTVLLTSGAASVSGGSTTVLTYTVAVKAGAETGAVYIDGYCTGADRNWTNNRVSDTTAAPDTDIWDVQGAGVIEIVSVTATPDTVSRSQTTLRVVLVLRNSGSGIITNVDTPALSFTELGANRTGDYDTAVTGTDTFFPVTMLIGTQFSCTYAVTVHGNADTGFINVDGVAQGLVSGGSVTTADTRATTADTFLVQTPAQIVIDSIDVSPEPLTQGEAGITVNYYLSNTGEAGALITGDTDAVTHALGGQSDSWVRTSASLAGTLVPGRTVGAAYPVTYQLAYSADTGAHYFDGAISATDVNDSRSAGDTTAGANGDTVTVNAARPLVIVSLAAAVTAVTAGQATPDSWYVLLTLQNTTPNDSAVVTDVGDTNIIFSVGGLTATDYTYNFDSVTVNDTQLAPWDTCVLRYRVTATGDSTGTLRLDATVSGTHALTASQVGHSTAGDTTPPDTLAVLAPALLTVTRVIAAADTVTRGQTGGDSVLVTLLVYNSGQAAAINLSDTLTFSRGGTNVTDSYAVLTVSESLTIPGGDTGTFTYRVSVAAGADTGFVAVDGWCTGTDVNASSIQTSDSRAALVDTWLVQSPAALQLVSVSSDSTLVYRGLAYRVTLVVRNAGEAPVDLTDSRPVIRRAAGDTVVTDSYTVSYSSGAASVNGGSTVALVYMVTVGASAETGAVVLDGYCTGTDRNWTTNIIADTSAAPDTDAWQVEGTGALTIVRVTANLDTVSRSQTTLTVALVLQNTGAGRVTNIDTPVLRFSELGTLRTGDYDTAMLAADTAFPATLMEGATTSCTFTVTVHANADTGYICVDGEAAGRVSDSTGATGDSYAATPDTFLVQTPAQLVIQSLDVTVEPLTQGQAGITVNYYLSNTGEANALITGDTDAVTHALGGQSDSWVRTGASLAGTLVPGGTNNAAYPVIYRVDISADTGAHYFDGAVSATDANDSRSAGDTTAGGNGDTVLVNAARPLVVSAVAASVLTVTAGQATPDSWYVTVTLQNLTPNDSSVVTDVGDTNIIFSVGGLTATDYTCNFDSVTVNDTQLAPGDSCVLRYRVTATGDSTGTLRLDATVSGTHALAGSRAGHSTAGDTTPPDTVAVLVPATLTVTRVIAAADTVTRGQTGGDSIAVLMLVYNSGQAAAINLADTLTFKRGANNVTDSYMVVTVSESVTIPAGDTGTFAYRVSVAAGADTGFVVIDGWCTGTDVNASSSQSTDSGAGAAAVVDTWLVQSPAALQIIAVSSDSPVVYRGLAYRVTLVVRNNGEAPADFTDSRPVIRRAVGDTVVTDSYTVALQSGAASVNGGGTVALVYMVTVGASAETGAVVLDGYCTGTDRNWTGMVTADTSAAPDTDTWQVEGTGALTLVSVTANLDTVSRGQTTLTVALVLQNTGAGRVTNIDTPTLWFSELGTLRTGDYDTAVLIADTVFPATLLEGATTSCTYSVTVHANADTGYICVNGAANGWVSDSQAATSDSYAATADTFLVQTPAQIVIQSIDVTVEPVTQGQAGITVNYYLSNTGEAPARITGDTDVVSLAGSAAQGDSWVRTGASLAGTMVPGGTNNAAYPVVYRVDISAGTGTVNFDGAISATDANDSREVGDVSAGANADSVVVNQATPILITGIAANVATVTGGQSTPDSWWVYVAVANTTDNDSSVLTNVGGTNLAFSVGGLTATDYAYNFDAVTVNDTQLAPGDSCVLRYVITATGDSAGTLRLDATLTGTHALAVWTVTDHTLADTIAPDTVSVLMPATLSVVRITAGTDTVTRGQSGGDSVLVTMWVYNSGQATAINLSDTLTFRRLGQNVGDSYAAVTVGESLTIPGGDTGTFSYRVSVAAGADTGYVALDGSCTGTDANASSVVSFDSTAVYGDTWLVQSRANLVLVSVTSDTATVYQGQGGYVVRLTVLNTGEAIADFTDSRITARRNSGDTDITDSFTSAFAGGPASVRGGETAVLSFTVAVIGSAETGAVYLNGMCTGTDRNWTAYVTTDSTVAITATPDTLAWTVQGAGALDLVSVTALADTVSQGQTSLRVVLVFRNIGAGDITNVDTPTLSYFMAGTDRNAEYDDRLDSATIAFPATIGVGSIIQCTFAVTVSDTATQGYVNVDGAVDGDISGGAAVTADSRATTSDTFLVQVPASITNANISSSADTALTANGTDTVTISVVVNNTGGAVSTVFPDTTADLLITNGNGVDITDSVMITLLVADSLTLAGGGSDTVAYAITIPDSTNYWALGSITITVLPNRPAILDNNSGETVSDAGSGITYTIITYRLINPLGDTILAADSITQVYIPPAKFPVGTHVSIVLNPASAAITAAEAFVLNNPSFAQTPLLAGSLVQFICDQPADSQSVLDIVIKVAYNDAEIGGREEEAKVYYLDPAISRWVLDGLTQLGVDAVNNIASARVGHFSFYRVLVPVGVYGNLANLHAYPNPFRPNDGNSNTGRRYDGSVNSGITFDGLTNDCTIKIYTILGQLVAEGQVTGQGNWQWDARNQSGVEVASGMYIYQVTNGAGEERIGKLVIIR